MFKTTPNSVFVVFENFNSLFKICEEIWPIKFK